MSPSHELLALLKGSRAEVEHWPEVLRLADESRLLLPLWNVVDRDSLPPEISEKLSNRALHRTLILARLTDQLAQLIELLGPNVMAYKGLTLGALAFGDATNRMCGDLDLLVSADDYPAAVDKLLEDGFEFQVGTPPRCLLRLAYEVTLFHPERRVTVDLHRSFFSEAMPLELERRTTVRVGGKEIPTLPPTELFVLLCVHGCKHCWRELRWVYDLVGLARDQSLDWYAIHALAREKGAVRAVSVGLELARQLFGLKVTPLLRADERALELAEESQVYLFGQRPGLRQQQSYQWRVFDTARQRLRYLLVTLFRPHERDLYWLDLPKNLWYLYYPLRPVRVAWEQLKGMG